MEILNCDLQFEKAEIVVYNVLGKNVYQSTITKNQLVIDISDQPNGIYFVRIAVGNIFHTRKFIKQ
ncbi:MAG: hypothetical protein COA57_01240 [Flavobacteriales bacterium]|nr:MAG: hypothetical protein COA57_01240 [Flavobacteriales bacterium]